VSGWGSCLWSSGRQDAGRTYSREKSATETVSGDVRRATVGRPERDGGGQKEGEIDYAPRENYRTLRGCWRSAGERKAGCNGQGEVGGGGGALGQSRFSFGFSQPSQ
jgi:hypothetical protein